MNPYAPTQAPASTKSSSLFSLAFRIALIWYFLRGVLEVLGIVSVARDKAIYDTLYVAEMLIGSFRIAYLLRHTRSLWLILAFLVEWVYYAFVLAYLLELVDTPPRFPFLAVPWIGFAITLSVPGRARRIGLVIYASLLAVSSILQVMFLYLPNSLPIWIAREIIRLATLLLVVSCFLTYDFEAHLQRLRRGAEPSHNSM